MDEEKGFTLIEILTTLALAAIVLTLGASAFRSYWLVRSLEGGAQETQALFRSLQTRVTSESHPLVYGARMPVSGSQTIGLVKYDPAGGAGGVPTCVQYGTAKLNATGMTAAAQLTFPDTTYSPTNVSGFGFVESTETTFCRTSGNLTSDSGGTVTSPPVATNDQYVWFYARGTATPGRVQVVVPALPGRAKTAEVAGLTARVTTP